jgi:hypothetical protein
MRCPFERSPKFEIRRIAKVEGMFNMPDTDKHFTLALFLKFFRREVSLRCGIRRNSQVVDAVERHGMRVDAIGKKIFLFSKECDVKAVNVAFIFLNRYYPFMSFSAFRAYLTAMNYYWDEFMLNISNDPLLLMMNYDESHRKIVTGVARELNEARKSNKFKAFIRDYCERCPIYYPDHFSERSMLFETVLVLLQEINDYELFYFYENHAMEILKAITLYLKRFKAENEGNIKINLGNFTGKYAMKALRSYEKMVKERRWVGHKQYRFKDTKELGAEGQKYYSF